MKKNKKILIVSCILLGLLFCFLLQGLVIGKNNDFDEFLATINNERNKNGFWQQNEIDAVLSVTNHGSGNLHFIDQEAIISILRDLWVNPSDAMDAVSRLIAHYQLME